MIEWRPEAVTSNNTQRGSIHHYQHRGQRQESEGQWNTMDTMDLCQPHCNSNSMSATVTPTSNLSILSRHPKFPAAALTMPHPSNNQSKMKQGTAVAATAGSRVKPNSTSEANSKMCKLSENFTFIVTKVAAGGAVKAATAILRVPKTVIRYPKVEAVYSTSC